MGPIRGQTRPVPVATSIVPQKIEAKLNAGIHNRFDIEVIDSESGEVRQRAQAENVLCTGFWAGALGRGYSLTYIAYGSGSGTPTAADTALFSQIDKVAPSSSDDIFADDTTNCVYSIKRKIVLSETVSVGKTITEIGFHNGTNLSSHAMLQDMNGNQISIVKTAQDIVTIYATVFVEYSRVKTIIEAYAYQNNYSKENFLKIAAGYKGFSASGDTSGYPMVRVRTVAEDYNHEVKAPKVTTDVASKTITVKLPRFGADFCNGYGITKFELWCEPIWTVLSFESVSLNLGSDVVGESIGTGDGTTKDFSTYFTLASAATIYLDGVKTTAFTLDKVSNHTADIHFSVAPTNGAVITADYHTDLIAKDVNHVYDLTLVFQFGEYTG